jgi:hypothetical protein
MRVSASSTTENLLKTEGRKTAAKPPFFLLPSLQKRRTVVELAET